MTYRLSRTLALVLVLIAYAAPNASANTFLFGFEDLPLMEGLEQVARDSVLFDTPEGRIVQASAVGTVLEEDVLAFYTSTLPQLGWTALAPATFRREGEILRLEFSEIERKLLVKFFTEPGTAAAQ